MVKGGVVPCNPDVPKGEGVELSPIDMFDRERDIKLVDYLEPVFMVTTYKMEIET